jgi:hypothetical protein
MDYEPVVVFAGSETAAETLATMLRARGLAAVSTPTDKSDTTAIIEAVIHVPPDQVDDARALIADVESGAAART